MLWSIQCNCSLLNAVNMLFRNILDIHLTFDIFRKTHILFHIFFLELILTCAVVFSLHYKTSFKKIIRSIKLMENDSFSNSIWFILYQTILIFGNISTVKKQNVYTHTNVSIVNFVLNWYILVNVTVNRKYQWINSISYHRGLTFTHGWPFLSILKFSG